MKQQQRMTSLKMTSCERKKSCLRRYSRPRKSDSRTIQMISPRERLISLRAKRRLNSKIEMGESCYIVLLWNRNQLFSGRLQLLLMFYCLERKALSQKQRIDMGIHLYYSAQYSTMLIENSNAQNACKSFSTEMPMLMCRIQLLSLLHCIGQASMEMRTQ